MLDDNMKNLADHERRMGDTAVHNFQQAVNANPEMVVQALAQITATVYAMHKAIVRFDT
jgi:hypothetical protein